MKASAVLLALLAALAPGAANGQPIEQDFFQRGLRLLAQQRYEAASREFTRALYANAAWGEPHYGLARVYAEWPEGADARKAADHYARAKALGAPVGTTLPAIASLEVSASPAAPTPALTAPGAPLSPPASPANGPMAQPAQPLPAVPVVVALPALAAPTPDGVPQPAPPLPAVPVVIVPAASAPAAPTPGRAPLPVTATLVVTPVAAPVAPPAALADEELLVPPDTETGKLLARRQRGQPLDAGDQDRLFVFDSFYGRAIRAIERGDVEKAQRYGDGLLRAAPDTWHAYYLQARIALENDDRVTAKEWWDQARDRGYLPLPRYPDLGMHFRPPAERLPQALAEARVLMGDRQWIAADDVLRAAEELSSAAIDSALAPLRAELVFRRGQIAYQLGDLRIAVRLLDLGIQNGYRPAAAQALLDSATHAQAQAQAALGVADTAAAVAGTGVPPVPTAYGALHVDLGRYSYLTETVTLTGLSGTEEPARTGTSRPHEYGVDGGRVYHVRLDLRHQLRLAALHGAAGVALVGLILLL